MRKRKRKRDEWYETWFWNPKWKIHELMNVAAMKSNRKKKNVKNIKFGFFFLFRCRFDGCTGNKLERRKEKNGEHRQWTLGHCKNGKTMHVKLHYADAKRKSVCRFIFTLSLSLSSVSLSFVLTSILSLFGFCVSSYFAESTTRSSVHEFAKTFFFILFLKNPHVVSL